MTAIHQKPINTNTFMSGADSMFLNIENDACPMNMGLLFILGECDKDALVQRVKETMAGDSSLSISLRRKIQPAPWNIDQPRWVSAPEYDVDAHIFQHEIDEYADDESLNKIVAKIMQTRMTISKPMWEFHIITGLRENKTALVHKLHHSYADGNTGVLQTQAFLDKQNHRQRHGIQADEGDKVRQPTGATPSPRWKSLLRIPAQALVTFFAYLGLKSYITYRYTLRDFVQSFPFTRFNTPITKERSYARGTLPINEVREICMAFNCSRNEVFLGIISGSLRQYLKENNELPDKPIYAGLPLVQFNDDSRSGASNQLLFFRSSLATHKSDPAERLSNIKHRLERATLKAKDPRNKRLLERLAKAPPRAIASLSALYLHLLEKGLLRPNFNLFTTLMPGPSKTSFIVGAEIEAIHPISIPYHGAGLFISGIRYKDNIQFGIHADRKQLPEPNHLADLMVSSFNELLALARTQNK